MSNFMMCTMCRRIFIKGTKSKEYINHKEYCNGIIFDIDEMMIPAIDKLLEKNYVTANCCSGHCCNDSGGPYIMFISDYLAPYDYPEGWGREIEKRQIMYNGGIQTVITIRSLMSLQNFHSKIKKQEYINLSMNNLYNWIDRLEYNGNPKADQIADLIKVGKFVSMNIDGNLITIAPDFNLFEYKTIYDEFLDQEYFLYKGQWYNKTQLIKNFAPYLDFHELNYIMYLKGIKPGEEIIDDTIFNSNNCPISFVKKGE